MARIGLTNALRLALSGATGAAEGYGAKQDRLKKDEQMRQALERQKEQDALTMALKKAELAESGWMEEPQFEAQRNAAGLGLGSTLASALQVAGGGSPLTPQGDMSSISRGTLTQKPAGKITFGGSNLVLPETQAMRQERIGKAASYDAQQKAQRAQEAKQAEIHRTASLIRQSYRTADGKQLSEEQSRYAAESGKNPMELGLIERPMTAAERARLGIDRERLGLDREKFAFDKTKPDPNAQGAPDFRNDLQIIQDFLPTVDSNGKIIPPKRKLSGAKALAVQEGGPSGTLSGKVANLAATSLGVDMTDEQVYNTIAEGVATAYAINEQRGRNVSDRDIANRVSQVKVLPNEVGSLEVQRLKGQRLQEWANRLMGNKVPQISPGQTYKMPSAQTQPTPAQKTLEQEFPGQAAKIREARSNGFSDEQIRAYLRGGR